MRLDNYLTEGIHDKGIMKAVMMAGNPGCGKSYVLQKLTDGNVDPKVVNVDTWVEFYKMYTKQKWQENSTKVKTLNNKQLAMYINSLLPLWIDGTSSYPPSVMRRTGILKSLGYDVAMIWVETSLETSLDRAEKRERPVDPDYIKQIYGEIRGFKKYYKSEFNPFLVVKNDDGELTDKIVLKSFKKMSKFFSSPIKNLIGSRRIEDMKKNGHKYLIDTDDYDMSDISKLMTSWYRKK